jgi:4'-phosphopantetheinyl transferase EntD
VGIDVEDDRPLEEDLWPTVCTPEEMATLAHMLPSARGHWVNRVFCAKEAYYKWQYPQTGKMLDFSDVQLNFDHDLTKFRVGRAQRGKAPVLVSVAAGEVRTLHGVTFSWLVGPPNGAARGMCSSTGQAQQTLE